MHTCVWCVCVSEYMHQGPYMHVYCMYMHGWWVITIILNRILLSSHHWFSNKHFTQIIQALLPCVVCMYLHANMIPYHNTSILFCKYFQLHDNMYLIVSTLYTVIFELGRGHHSTVVLLLLYVCVCVYKYLT